VSWYLEKETLRSDTKKIFLKEVQAFVNFIIQNKKNPSTVSLAEIEYFDPVLLAWMSLLNKNSIKVVPPKNDEYAKLCQLSILLKDQYLKLLTFKFPIDVSKDFSPIFVIKKESFKFLFVKDFAEIWNKLKKFFDDEQIREKFNSFKNSKIALKEIIRELCEEDGKLNIEEVSVILYFIESLTSLGLIRKTIDNLFNNNEWKNRPQRLGISGMRRSQELEYENKAMSFVEKYLISQTPFFIYLFSLYTRNFYNIYLMAQKEKKRNIETYINEIQSLYEFCRRFYLGIKELAKNIVQHVGQGAIVIRVYDKEKCKEFINETKQCSGIEISPEELLEEDKKINNNKYKGIFLIYVLDVGEKGIVRTMIEKLKNWKKIKEKYLNEDSINIISSDILRLEKGKITLRNFYDYKNGFKMLHQTIRTAAGIGLVIFSNLLTKDEHKGLMWVSSPNKDNNSQMDSIFMYHKFWTKDFQREVYSQEIKNYLFPVGTCYLFILPVPNVSKFKERLFNYQITEKIQSPASNSIFLEMASVQNENKRLTGENLKFITSDRVLIKWIIDIKPPISKDLKNLQKLSQEWKEHEKQLKIQFPNQIPIPIIWLKSKNSLDVSDIFHLLAMVELLSKAKSIVLSNIEEGTIKFFIEILSAYDKANMSVWSKESFSLIIPSSSLLPPFIVGGEKYEDLEELNNYIAKFYNNNFWINELKKLNRK